MAVGAGAPSATLVDQATSSFFGNDDAVGLPGLDDDDQLDIFAVQTHVPKQSDQSNNHIPASVDLLDVHVTLGGNRGDAIESLVVADATMRAAGAMPTIINTAVRVGNCKAKAIIEPESTWSA